MDNADDVEEPEIREILVELKQSGIARRVQIKRLRELLRVQVGLRIRQQQQPL